MSQLARDLHDLRAELPTSLDLRVIAARLISAATRGEGRGC
jgi:hypothetical protein